jgi:hypothetical protein
MKATLVGTLEKVFPINQMPNTHWKQDIVVVEEGKGNMKEKPFMIQCWADKKEQLERLSIGDLKNQKVICECYWNGYQYEDPKHGTRYAIRVSLINIKIAE